MTEEIITFETAKLAKDKFFEKNENLIKVSDWYDEKGKLNTLPVFVSAPTQSLLQKWLREEYDIIVTVQSKRNPKDTVRYNYRIDCKEEVKYEFGFYTYEQALEKGLHEALKLI